MPAVVPGMVVVFVPPLLPQPVVPAIAISATTPSAVMLSAVRHVRRRPGTPKKKTSARVAPPPRKNLFKGVARALVVEAVVATVKVAVAAVAPLMVTDEPTVHVGGSLGLVMDVVTAHDRFTAPVKPPPGVTVIVDVLPVVAPETTVILPLLVSAMVGDPDVPEGPVTVRVVFEEV